MPRDADSRPAGPRPSRGRVLVVGGGRFGQKAVTSLGSRVLAVVEPQPSPELLALGAPVWPLEGVVGLRQALAAPRPPVWVAPCLPRHLLADWLRAELSHLAPRTLPLDAAGLADLPQVIAGEQGQLYLSLTDTRCPDNCPEPARICLKTGLPRGVPLHQRLAGLARPGFANAVLVSRQMAPGLGAVAVAEMLFWRDQMARRGGQWLVATACRCHGVLEALTLTAGPLAPTREN